MTVREQIEAAASSKPDMVVAGGHRSGRDILQSLGIGELLKFISVPLGEFVGEREPDVSGFV